MSKKQAPEVKILVNIGINDVDFSAKVRFVKAKMLIWSKMKVQNSNTSIVNTQRLISIRKKLKEI